MRIEESDEVNKRLIRNSVGLLGTEKSPTKLKVFFNDYIEMKKEEVASAADAETWAKAKAILDALVEIQNAIRNYEHAYIDKQNEEKEEAK